MSPLNNPSSFIRALGIGLAVVLALTASVSQAEPFTLTDKQGRSIKADVLEVTNGQVKIKRDDGQTFSLPLANLSETDQQKLNEWAKSLPPGAVQFEFSRGIFKTIKTDKDAQLVNGKVIKDGITLTEDKWGYNVTITNKTPSPIENLRTEYRLFATIDNVHVSEESVKLKKKAFQSPIETVPALGKIVFKTETISAVKMKYNGNIVSAKTGENHSREVLSGIWIRVYRGSDLIHETIMPEKIRETQKW